MIEIFKFARGGKADINQQLLDLNSGVRILIAGIVCLRVDPGD
jgi:hypothetical protein